MLSAGAMAQTPLLPPPGAPNADRCRRRRKSPRKRQAKTARGRQEARAGRDAETRGNAAPAATVTPAPAFEDPNVDLVYGAYQRGQYKTAFDLATNRAQFNGDPKAMTMLGELYANAMGVKRDYAKAAEWYKRAADGGDREGMFALAMLRLPGAAARSTARRR